MESKLAEVRQRLGTRLGLRETELRETLWYYYFDVDETVAWLAGPSSRKVILTTSDKYKKADTSKPNKNSGAAKPVTNQGRLSFMSLFVFQAMNMKLWNEV